MPAGLLAFLPSSTLPMRTVNSLNTLEIPVQAAVLLDQLLTYAPDLFENWIIHKGGHPWSGGCFGGSGGACLARHCLACSGLPQAS